MKTWLLLCCGALLAFAADDPWAKVKEIKSGAELRVYKKGSMQPLLVKMGDATDERLIIINKNEETSIAKEDIDRIDARPSNKRPVTKETKETVRTVDPKTMSPGPNSSASSGLSIGSRPDFETVYRRPMKK